MASFEHVSLLVISEIERAKLDKGKRRRYKVPAHERSMTIRSPQAIKDRNFEEFAQRLISQGERYGWSAVDRRHARNLFEVFHQYDLLTRHPLRITA